MLPPTQEKPRGQKPGVGGSERGAGWLVLEGWGQGGRGAQAMQGGSRTPQAPTGILDGNLAQHLCPAVSPGVQSLPGQAGVQGVGLARMG